MNGLRPVLDNLVLCLDFMNPKTTVGIGVICSDLSGNKNDVTLFNGATYSNSKEIVFDGVNDYIACGNIIAGRTQFSAEVWVKTIQELDQMVHITIHQCLVHNMVLVHLVILQCVLKMEI